MKSSFLDEVVRWNGGYRRGAAAKFARAVGVSEPVMSRWMKGKDAPGEEKMRVVAEALKLDLETVGGMFGRGSSVGEPQRGYSVGDLESIRDELIEHARRIAELEQICKKAHEGLWRRKLRPPIKESTKIDLGADRPVPDREGDTRAEAVRRERGRTRGRP